MASLQFLHFVLPWLNMYIYLINQDLLDLKEFEGEGQSQIFQKPTLELKQFP